MVFATAMTPRVNPIARASVNANMVVVPRKRWMRRRCDLRDTKWGASASRVKEAVPPPEAISGSQPTHLKAYRVSGNRKSTIEGDTIFTEMASGSNREDKCLWAVAPFV